MPWTAEQARAWRAANREHSRKQERDRARRNTVERNAKRRRQWELMKIHRSKEWHRIGLTEGFAIDSVSPEFAFVYRGQVKYDRLKEPLPTWTA